MKNYKNKVINAIVKVLFVFLTLIFIVLGIVGWRLYENGEQVYFLRKQQILSLMDNNPEFFNEVFGRMLPMALDCKGEASCIEEVRNELDSLVSLAQKPTAFVSKPDHFSQVLLNNDQPMYFISVKDSQIHKLFFSGEVKSTQVKTGGENKVRGLLFGERGELYGLQANVDGLRMTYLNDLYSEAEVIVPYLKDGEIIGAVVYLHGD